MFLAQKIHASPWSQATFLIRTGIMGTEMSGRECERLLQPDELLGIQLGLQLVAGLNDLCFFGSTSFLLD